MTGGKTERNEFAFSTGAAKDGTINVIFDDGVLHKKIPVQVKNGDSKESVVGKVYWYFWKEVQQEYSSTGSGGSIYLTALAPEVDRSVQMTIEDPEGTGVTGALIETRPGEVGQGGVQEVNVLEITQAPNTPVSLSVKFTYQTPYTTNETATVALSGTESVSEVAEAIAEAFSKLNGKVGILHFTTTASDANVVFTSKKPLADQNITISVTKQ